MSILTILLLGILILITHFLEGLTGFGSTVLAMPFAIMLVGINIAKPILTIVGLLLSLYVVIISYKDILWEHYFRIVTFVVLGLPIGMWLFDKLPEDTLKVILGLFMIIVSIRGLIIAYKGTKHNKPINNSILSLFLFLGGCMHGAFSSGGPLVILYASEKLPNKSNFRATLSMLWVSLNSIIVLQSALSHRITPDVLKLSLYTLPFLAAGAVLGNLAHHKIKEGSFTKIVYVVLFISALFMFK
ncbi:MAG: sulfite exporter TauE/SafE family protein [Clostridium lundense]|nr:sulfite exporter TauE/SafE family protein [Clostridium lundense]